MRASEFITEADLDEGWKSGLAALGVAGGLAMGGFGSKNKDISYDITPGVQPTQSIQKVQPQAQPQVQQPTQQVRTPSTPEELKTYCGDDFLFHNLYEKGFDLAYITSSPMVHFEGQSKPYMIHGGAVDTHTYLKMGLPHYLRINTNYSNIKPTKIFITN